MEKNPADWKRMIFKKNKVWVSTDADGNPAVEDGKVLIKYQLDQPHEYKINEDNLRPIDSIAQDTPSAAASKKKKNSPKSKKTPAQPTDIPKNAICVYTDGAASGNPGPAGIGVLLRHENHEKEISKFIGHATNNIAELEAIKAGLLEIKKKKLPVRVFTDSGYAFGLLEQGWKAKKNQNLVKSIKDLISTFKDVKLIKVKGHAGHPENERADQLATSAIKK